MKVDASEWIITWCLKSEREQKEALEQEGRTYRKLVGRLDLYNFVNLEKIILCDNRLESIDISRLPKLREINLSNNRLTILDVSQNPALEKLDIRSNKITANLSIFSHLTNLKELKLGGIFAKKNKVVWVNNFSGSLSSLAKLENLEHFDISQQVNIESEYLQLFSADKLKEFFCQGTVFEEQLRPLNFNVKAWQLSNTLIIHEEAMKVMDAHYRERIVGELKNEIESLENQNKELTTKLAENPETIQKGIEQIKNEISDQSSSFSQSLVSLNRIITDCQKVIDQRQRRQQLEDDLSTVRLELQEEQERNDLLEDELQEWEKEQIEEIEKEEKEEKKRLKDKITQTDKWEPIVGASREKWQVKTEGDSFTPLTRKLEYVGMFLMAIVAIG
jgi:hypothetical protein